LSREPLLSERHAAAGARWKVATVRPEGRYARTVAGEVASQLRAAGSTAVDIGVNRTDPFIGLDAGRDALHGPRGPFDLILAVGDVTPTAVALAVSLDVPVAPVPMNLWGSVPRSDT